MRNCVYSTPNASIGKSSDISLCEQAKRFSCVEQRPYTSRVAFLTTCCEDDVSDACDWNERSLATIWHTILGLLVTSLPPPQCFSLLALSPLSQYFSRSREYCSASLYFPANPYGSLFALVLFICANGSPSSDLLGQKALGRLSQVPAMALANSMPYNWHVQASTSSSSPERPPNFLHWQMK